MAAPNIEGTFTGNTLAAGTKGNDGVKIQSATTANAPAYAKGVIYFDLTTNKLMIGGATAFETVTSS